MSDNANSSVGFVIGFKADTRDDAPKVLVRQDVLSRVGAHNYIELDTLAAPANVKQFVEEMLSHLIDQNQANQRIQSESLPSTTKTYPFTASGSVGLAPEGPWPRFPTPLPPHTFRPPGRILLLKSCRLSARIVADWYMCTYCGAPPIRRSLSRKLAPARSVRRDTGVSQRMRRRLPFRGSRAAKCSLTRRSGA